ncbi:MAG TPA: DUF420 domain-containing protein [Actinobacteria bacterium]|nr:DUF420 domain-containing protein [Actinomycetota bacterium]
MTGFLGTRAGVFSDLLLVSLLVLVPAFTTGYFLARRHKGAWHRLAMLISYSFVLIFVIIYIIDNLVEGFPPFRGDRFSNYNIIYLIIGLTHSLLAMAALIMGGRQIYLGNKFSSSKSNWTMRPEDRIVHARFGVKTLIVFASTTITGILLYFWVFVAGTVK